MLEQASGTGTVDVIAQVKQSSSKRDMNKLAKQVAQDLKQEHMQMWSKATADDLTDMEKNCPYFTASANKTTAMVAEDILLASSPKEQMKIYKFYLAVAEQSMKQGDLSYALKLCMGLQATSV